LFAFLKALEEKKKTCRKRFQTKKEGKVGSKFSLANKHEKSCLFAEKKHNGQPFFFIEFLSAPFFVKRCIILIISSRRRKKKNK